jgi:hypothetical protein
LQSRDWRAFAPIRSLTHRKPKFDYAYGKADDIHLVIV